MTDTASLELSKELYELSGWVGAGQEWSKWHHGILDINKGAETFEGEYRVVSMSPWRDETVYPAYDLGYLLRKLPRALPTPAANWLALYPADANGHQWTARYEYIDIAPDDQKIRAGSDLADSPEDAAVKLAIELFRKGILTRESHND